MPTETNVQQVKVNLMTQAQYDEADKNLNEFYVITDQDYVTETELESKGYLTEHQDISNLATKEEVTTGLSDKQDIISDLTTIREGASKGATALQSVPDEYITETELESKGYLTEHQDISNLATKEEVNSKQDKLVSGTTIKTINGEPILGSGNIKVEAGIQYAMVVVDHTV